jgi:hypothetical protein
MEEAHSRIQAYAGMFDTDMTMYRGIIERNRMNVDDIVPKFGPFDPYKQTPNSAGSDIVWQGQSGTLTPNNPGQMFNVPGQRQPRPGVPTLRFNPATGRMEPVQ